MSPQVNVSGSTLASSSKQYVTRCYTGTVKLATGTHLVTSISNPLPDGCKVLKVVAKNLTGRSLTLAVPMSSGLVLSVAEGTSAAPFGGVKKFVTAPYTRFPTLKVQVPDLLAAPLDTGSATGVELFTVGSLDGASTDTVQLTYTVRYTL
jgi:hypothetical protein